MDDQSRYEKFMEKYPTNYPTPPDAIDEDKLFFIRNKELPSWRIVKSPLPENTLKLRTELYREYVFESFEQVIAYINEVSKICDVFAHHPRWENSWKTLRVFLTTWDSQHIITYKDVMMARKMDAVYKRFDPKVFSDKYTPLKDSRQFAKQVIELIDAGEVEEAWYRYFEYITRSTGLEQNEAFSDMIDKFEAFKNSVHQEKMSKELMEDKLGKLGGELKDRISNQMPKAKIYFSYAWGKQREDIVDELYASLLKDASFELIRDKVDLGYTGLISDFMKMIGKGNLVIVALSDKYLKSEYCMFELYELFRNSNLDKTILLNKIFPIRVEDLDLGNPEKRYYYYKYWKDKEAAWKKIVDELDKDHQTYNLVKSINFHLDQMFQLLDDINAKTVDLLQENDFAEIKQAIQNQIKEKS